MRANAGRPDTLPASVAVDIALKLVVADEPEVGYSNLTVPLILRDFSVMEGFEPEGFLLLEAFFSSGVSGLYLYSMKSGSLSQTATFCC